MLENIPYVGSLTRMIFNFGANLGATVAGFKETLRRVGEFLSHSTIQSLC